MRFKVKKDFYFKNIIKIVTFGRAEVCYLIHDKVPKSKDQKLYYFLDTGYFDSGRVKIIGVDLIDEQ